MLKKSNISNKPLYKPRKFFLKFRCLFYLTKQDKCILLKYFFNKFFFHAYNLLRSFFNKTPFKKIDNYYLFNLSSLEDFKKEIISDNSLLVIGFSYCQKPIQCPKGRFSNKCDFDSQNSTCRQCFIGKCKNLLKNEIFLLIPTAKHLGIQIIDIINKNKNKNFFFVITSCFFSIEMFSNLAHMLKIKVIALELFGKVCLTYNSFLLAEQGKKTDLTYLNSKNEKILLNLLNIRKN